MWMMKTDRLLTEGEITGKDEGYQCRRLWLVRQIVSGRVDQVALIRTE